jgi:hypothetical protein
MPSYAPPGLTSASNTMMNNIQAEYTRLCEAEAQRNDFLEVCPIHRNSVDCPHRSMLTDRLQSLMSLVEKLSNDRDEVQSKLEREQFTCIHYQSALKESKEKLEVVQKAAVSCSRAKPSSPPPTTCPRTLECNSLTIYAELRSLRLSFDRWRRYTGKLHIYTHPATALDHIHPLYLMLTPSVQR